MIKDYFKISVKRGKMLLPQKITSKIKSQRTVFTKNKKDSKEVVIGTLVDSKVICIPVKRELDVETMLSQYKKAVDGLVLDKLEDIYYADMKTGLFLYENEIYFKSQCGFGYTSVNIKTGVKLKDILGENTNIDNIKVTVLDI